MRLAVYVYTCMYLGNFVVLKESAKLSQWLQSEWSTKCNPLMSFDAGCWAAKPKRKLSRQLSGCTICANPHSFGVSTRVSVWK
jgi:hypothetical protein